MNVIKAIIRLIAYVFATLAIVVTISAIMIIGDELGMPL